MDARAWMSVAVAVLGFVGRVDTVNRFDVLELNRTHNDDGRATLTQWVAWDWDHAAGVHRCQWWTLSRGEIATRTGDGWRVTCGGKLIESRSYRETWTRDDPELADRARWPVERRRKVR